MFYSKDFKTRVKKAYPNFKELHRSLECGNDYTVGLYLSENSSSSISITTVLEATSLKELQNKAKAEKEKVELYKEWCELYCKQNKILL